MQKPSDLTIAVLEFIKANSGVTVDEIATQLDKPKNKVKDSVCRLVRTEQIDSHVAKRGIAAKYTAAPKAPQLVQPMNGPGHTMRPLGKLAEPTASPLRNSTTSGKYNGAELRPFTDRTDANDHMQHGRVEGGKWMPYAPPSLMCVGAVSGPVGGGQSRRFA